LLLRSLDTQEDRTAGSWKHGLPERENRARVVGIMSGPVGSQSTSILSAAEKAELLDTVWESLEADSRIADGCATGGA